MIPKDKSVKVVNGYGLITHEGNHKEMLKLVKLFRREGQEAHLWKSYTHKVGENINSHKSY